jgi:hypothetical protein
MIKFLTSCVLGMILALNFEEVLWKYFFMEINKNSTITTYNDTRALILNVSKKMISAVLTTHY